MNTSQGAREPSGAACPIPAHPAPRAACGTLEGSASTTGIILLRL